MIAGRYALEAEIGRGGMGTVWRGRDEVLGRVVALKKIGVAPGATSPDALRAEREARLAARLSHANVVSVFDLVTDAGDGPGEQWLVMEYVEGTNLAEMIRARGRLSHDEAAPLLSQTALALAAAHAAGVVHRDVKPSNILVTPEGRVKLSDFGIARTATDPALTQTGLVTGSPAYLSPEVASGQQATPASDVWSWGATLFHALEGRPPYAVGDNLLGALYRIVHEEPPRPEAAGWLTPVLEGTMTREPGRRWPIERAQEFVDAGPGLSIFPTPATGSRTRTRSRDVAAAGTQVLPLPAPPTRPPTPVQPPAPRDHRGRRSWLWVVAAALVVVVAMIAAFEIGLRGDGDDSASDGGASSPPASSSTSTSTSPSGSPSTSAPAAPEVADMEAFVRTYIDTVVSNPSAAFKMLTPEFQAASKGESGYVGFWGDVHSAEIISIEADPATLEVLYVYRYQKGSDRPVTDPVTLRLQQVDGGFLIAGEA